MASMVFKYGAKKMMKGNKEKSSKKSGDSETVRLSFGHVLPKAGLTVFCRIPTTTSTEGQERRDARTANTS